MYISILNIENFLEKPDGAKNHDGQKGQEKELMLQKIYNNNSTELFDILTTLTLLLQLYSSRIRLQNVVFLTFVSHFLSYVMSPFWKIPKCL